MSMPPIIDATLQGALLCVASNVVAQYILCSRQGAEFEVDWVPVFQFVLFGMISTPPNYLWQQFLESAFPSYPAPAPLEKSADDKPADDKPADDKPAVGKAAGEPKLSVRNTAIKLVLDQTLGAVANTLLFSGFHRSMQAALVEAPRETSIFKALGYWNSPGAIDFGSVDFGEVWALTRAEFWPSLQAGWKFWPAVALGNYTLVGKVETRNLVGGLAGIAWGTYMSLVVSE